MSNNFLEMSCSGLNSLPSKYIFDMVIVLARIGSPATMFYSIIIFIVILPVITQFDWSVKYSVLDLSIVPPFGRANMVDLERNIALPSHAIM